MGFLNRKNMVIALSVNAFIIILFHCFKIKRNEAEKYLDGERKGVVTVRLSNSLGTAMFQYAALLGIATINNREPAIPKDHLLRKYFHISAKHYQPDGVSSVQHIRDENPYKFNPSMETLQSNADVIELTGLFQSWMYFSLVHPRVLEEFRFQDPYQVHAKQYIEHVVQQSYGKRVKLDDVVVIGVHIRHHNVCSSEHIQRGFAAADVAYVTTTMDTMAEGLETEKFIFIICTDDMPFVDALPSRKYHIYVSRNHNEAEDLAILASCDDVIMTTGAFGWWSAYLASGQAAYYQPFALPGSEVEDHFEEEDYYLHFWQGAMGNSSFGACGLEYRYTSRLGNIVVV